MNNDAKLIGEIYQYMENIVSIAQEKNKQIIIWGFSRAGKFARDIIERVLGGKVSYIIDGGLMGTVWTADAVPMIYRPSLLWYVDADKTIILSCIQDIDEIKTYVEEQSLQYFLDDNLFNVRATIGNSILNFLEMNYDVDFSNVNWADADVKYRNDMLECQAFAHSSADRVFEEIHNLIDKICFFDYGCGKGATFVYAYLHGFSKIGGIEYSPNVACQCKKNMEILGIECDIACDDAAEYDDIDEYNVFYFYNPFNGETFDRVLDHICASVDRLPREAYLVYGNPFCHKKVIARNNISLYKQIFVDLYDPLLNIYTIERISINE